MTRNRKVDPEVLEREYIFDPNPDPVSLTQLADRHGLARSGVAEKALRGRWYERRKEFRAQLGEKVVAKLADEWVGMDTAVREQMMQTGLKYLGKFAEALENGDIKVNTRDMLGIAAMVRQLLLDTANRPKGEEALIDPTNVTFGEDSARAFLEEIKRLEAGQVDDDGDESGPAGRLEATGTEDSRPN